MFHPKLILCIFLLIFAGDKKNNSVRPEASACRNEYKHTYTGHKTFAGGLSKQFPEATIEFIMRVYLSVRPPKKKTQPIVRIFVQFYTGNF